MKWDLFWIVIYIIFPPVFFVMCGFAILAYCQDEANKRNQQVVNAIDNANYKEWMG